MTEFWSFFCGGLVLGGVATLYPLITGRFLGVSSSYASLFERQRLGGKDLSELEAAMLAATEAEFGAIVENQGPPSLLERLDRLRAEAERFRPLFLVGLAAGALLAALLSSRLVFELTLGQRFDARYGAFGPVSIAVLLVSGVLIGIGTRVAGGCTSGHGISGVARGQGGSWLSTMTFWGTALAVTWAFFLLRSK